MRVTERSAITHAALTWIIMFVILCGIVIELPAHVNWERTSAPQNKCIAQNAYEMQLQEFCMRHPLNSYDITSKLNFIDHYLTITIRAYNQTGNNRNRLKHV